MIAVYIIVASLVMLLSVILLRALTFKPSKNVARKAVSIELNKESIQNTMSALIRCRTVSYRDKSKEDEEEFIRFKNLLLELFPKIREKCEFKTIGDRGILFKLQGKCSDSATVMMAHYDVVPVDEDGWKNPPFSGVLHEGAIWGRGALDTKSTVNGSMQALEHLLKLGFVPENDLYFAFGGDEEINGHGASDIVSYFEENKIAVKFVFDEGGAVVSDIFPTVHENCALIGTAEKGIMNLKLTARSNGGHSSSPPKITPIERLSRACVKISDKPFVFRPSKPALDLFNSLGPYATLPYRIVFANLWLFRPFVSLFTKQKGGEINALVRTTCAFTQMKGSDGANVIPTEASMIINLRINQGENTESVIRYLEKVIDDPNVTIEPLYRSEPSEVSVTDCAEYSILKNAILSTWDKVIVSPYLMLACSDSRHWCRLSNKVYRFSPVEMVDEIRGTIHGNNERIPLEVLYKSVEFYINLITKC